MLVVRGIGTGTVLGGKHHQPQGRVGARLRLQRFKGRQGNAIDVVEQCFEFCRSGKVGKSITIGSLQHIGRRQGVVEQTACRVAGFDGPCALQRKVFKAFNRTVNRQRLAQFFSQRAGLNIQTVQQQQVMPAQRRQTLAQALNFINQGHTGGLREMSEN